MTRLLLFVMTLTLLVGCKNGPSPNPGPNTNKGTADSFEAEAKAYGEEVSRFQIEDSGQNACVDGFFDALRKKDFERAQTHTSTYVSTEIRLQYESLDLYAKALSRNEILLGKAQPFIYAPNPQKRVNELGTWVVRTLGEYRPDSLFAFYVVQANHGWVIDNILTAQALRIGQSAPAINMALSHPSMAFYGYYTGAIIGRHPPTAKELRAKLENTSPPLNSWSHLELSMKERLTYLRNSSTQNFLDAIAKHPDGADVAGFLDGGREVMLKNFQAPEFLDHSLAGNIVRFQLRPRKGSTQRPIVSDLHCKFEHGVWKLERQERAP
ncbi:MAG: hypothetical protein KDB07_11005 [Planctomycetes bacterium]|nr:hypothetical protein [Planctomycetota bacterium]